MNTWIKSSFSRVRSLAIKPGAVDLHGTVCRWCVASLGSIGRGWVGAFGEWWGWWGWRHGVLVGLVVVVMVVSVPSGSSIAGTCEMKRFNEKRKTDVMMVWLNAGYDVVSCMSGYLMMSCSHCHHCLVQGKAFSWLELASKQHYGKGSRAKYIDFSLVHPSSFLVLKILFDNII